MKSELIILGLLALPGCLAQKGKWKSIETNRHAVYEIKNEGKLYKAFFDAPNDQSPKHSSLIVNGDTLRNIMFTEAKLNQDTLKILVYQTDEAYHHAYQITIVNNKFHVDYSFLTSGAQIRRKIKRLATKLVVDTLEFRKGATIKGYTAYRGKCKRGCWEDLILVEGNFSATIE